MIQLFHKYIIKSNLNNAVKEINLRTYDYNYVEIFRRTVDNRFWETDEYLYFKYNKYTHHCSFFFSPLYKGFSNFPIRFYGKLKYKDGVTILTGRFRLSYIYPGVVLLALLYILIQIYLEFQTLPLIVVIKLFQFYITAMILMRSVIFCFTVLKNKRLIDKLEKLINNINGFDI